MSGKAKQNVTLGISSLQSTVNTLQSALNSAEKPENKNTIQQAINSPCDPVVSLHYSYPLFDSDMVTLTTPWKVLLAFIVFYDS
ncbi:MAG TPA: hypothetical protein VFC84_01450 [Desulfosporosinus sp.]|nr:hypothetical protein [Desulfosporosinus sp.]